MFKKLLVVVLALTFLVSLCSVALATKDPNQFKRGTHEIANPGAGRLLYNPQLIHPPTTPVVGVAPVFQPNPQPLQRSGLANCTVESQYCNDTYYFDGSGETGWGIAVRWDFGTETCTLKTISLQLDYDNSYAPFHGGVTAYVWSDNGSGLPGAVIASVNVPEASILHYPSFTDVPVSVVVAGGEFHTGFIPNNAGDVYVVSLDDGTCGQASSSLYIFSTWYGNGGIFQGGDLNFIMDIEKCCAEIIQPGVCGVQYWYCDPTYIWPGFTSAQRFTSVGACTVQTVWIAVADYGTLTGGVNVRVYSDAAGLPGAVLGQVFVSHANLNLDNWTSVDFTPLNLVFSSNENYHVAVISAIPSENYLVIGDDGEVPSSCGDGGVLRGSASTDGGLTWDFMATLDPGYDDNWLMEVEYCCAPEESNCENLNYAAAPAYFWPEPDIYGDVFRNERFSNASYCSLKTVNLGFYNLGTIGVPGVQVNIWNSDGVFPTSVITSYVIDPVVDFFPNFTSIDVTPANLILSGDYHVGYTTIAHNPSEVLAILSDDGSSGTGRSSEFYASAWYLMATSWGLDVDFLINVDVCCLPPGYCPQVCSPTDQWPIFGHDFARSGQSQLTLGDLCGIVSAWKFVATVSGNFSNPVISNDLVVWAHNDRIQAVGLISGLLVWDTKTIPAYTTYITTGLNSQVTISGGAFYAGNGTQRGMVKGDLLTGALIWGRAANAGNPLAAAGSNVTYGGSVIRGNEIYFGNALGDIFALDATTGATLYQAVFVNSAALRCNITGAPSTDGNQLFFPGGTLSGGATWGGIRSVIPGGGVFTPSWYWEGAFHTALLEGFFTAPSFRCDNLFVHASFANTNPNGGGYAGYRQNLDPATGIEKWGSYFLQGQNTFGGVIATNDHLAYFHNLNNGFTGPNNSRGVRAVNYANSTIWNNPGVSSTNDNNVWSPLAVTCDPYLVYSTRGGFTSNVFSNWRIVDGNTGVILVDYYLDFTGITNGTAIATASSGEDYLVVSCGNSVNPTAAGATLWAFKNGPPRPRLVVPQAVVEFPGTNDNEIPPVVRTDIDAIRNVGCATLNVTATLEAGTPPLARRAITDVDPYLAKKADELASSIIDHSVEEMMSVSFNAKQAKGGLLSEINAEGIEIGQTAAVKPAKANSEALAQPTWVDWVSPSVPGPATVNFSVAAGLGQNFTFEFDRSNMDFLAPNVFYVELQTNDPDYNLIFPLATPQATIEYQIPYEYCPHDTGRMMFGTTGSEWYTNYGRLADGGVNFEFTLSGSGDDFSYSGGMFFMTSMNDAAWNPDAGSVPPGLTFLYPFYVGPFANQDCGGCDLNVPLPVEYTTNGGVSYAPTIGDLCTFAMIDSLQGVITWPHQTGPSIGLLIKYREVGTYGADFDDFKLIVVDLINRNGTPINGLYYGCIEDWDIGSDQGFGDPAKGFVYQDDGAIRGFMGLPLSGSYFPDGSKTDPMYNARVIENGTYVYPSATCPECILDSLYALVNNLPEGGFDLMPDAGTNDDKSTIATFGKVNLAGGGTKSYGFAVYGFDASADFNGDSEALSKFVNKYAGFARGDVNNDEIIDLRDLVRLSRYVASIGPGPVPFKHLGDVDNDGDVDSADCAYLAAYFFTYGPAPKSAFKF